ncbi:hypothetical protein JP0030_13410 [Helicobacter pylori]
MFSPFEIKLDLVLGISHIHWNTFRMYWGYYSIKAFFFFVILENFCHFLILMRFVSFGIVRLVVLEG